MRAGIFDLSGHLLAHATRPITTFRSAGNKVEQSSDEIWQTVCQSIREAIGAAGVAPASVSGIGFGTTCSLLVLGRGGEPEPLPVGEITQPERNIIVWMDHRATEQAKRINETQHRVLQYVGGKMSPEMETPKILWLPVAEREPQGNL